MSQIRIPSLAIGLLPIMVVFTLSGCADNNSQATFEATTGKHTNDATLRIAGHSTVAKKTDETCKECHGEDLKGGISKVNCTTQCHLESADKVHKSAWGSFTYINHKETTDPSRCANASCHAKGGAADKKDCATACHIGDATNKHGWGTSAAIYSGHKAYVEANKDTTCANIACHGVNLDGAIQANGLPATGPACDSCHLGNTGSGANIIYAVHPAIAAGNTWSVAHQNSSIPRAKCDNLACHGVFDDAFKPGVIKVDKTCAATTCHAGNKN